MKANLSALFSALLSFFVSSAVLAAPDYNLVWTSPSRDSSESMPCGGGDIGLNVWAENGDILFYFARSDAFDENNSMLKQGRVRIRLSPNPFAEGGTFRQELKLDEGAIVISGKNREGVSSDIRIWADVFQPLIHVEVSNNNKISAKIFYENWRYQDRLLRKGENLQNSYKWSSRAEAQGLSTKKDEVICEDGKILFYHRNDAETVFDVTVKSQSLDNVKDLLFNPLKNLTFGGVLEARGFKNAGTHQGKYINTDYKAWALESEQPAQQWELTIKLHTAQTEDIATWKKDLEKPFLSDKQKNQNWWKDFHNRSFIRIQSKDGKNTGEEISRNYQLFRYTLACNAHGNYPTKFNGGTFTFDPVFVNKNKAFTPDFRNWAGGTFTAQNQRLSYYPMLKNGDSDWMTPQFDFYKRILQTAELRSKVYWGHGGACFSEQIDNFGLPEFSEYAGYPGMPAPRPTQYNPGVEYNPWLEYLWDAGLEFCYMILEKERYTGADISEYLPLIESSVRFFDEHYRYLAKQRGARALDGNGKLILYPSSGAETYKMAYNSTSTIAALQVVASRLLELPESYFYSETEKNSVLPYELFYTSEEDKKIVRYDHKGQVTWEYPAEIARDILLLPNNNILFCYNNNYDARKSGNQSGVIEVTPDKRIVFEYKTTGQVFSCARLANGDTAISASSQAKILIVDAKGNLKKEIITKSKPGHSSLRQVRGCKNGDILIAEELAKVVRRYDTQGNVIREIPMPYTPFGIIEKEDGNIIISGRSGVREVALDGKVVWDFVAKEHPQLGIRWCTGIELLSNGNILVANSGGKIRLFEINVSSGKPEIVWQVEPENLKLSLGHGVAQATKNKLNSTRKTYYKQLLKRLPEIGTREVNGHTLIAPAWQWERIGNTESPQLYPVFPWGIYGLEKPGLETAINTYLYDPEAVKFRAKPDIGWNQYAIWAARLGLTDEAKKGVIKKLENSGRRFPAFWGSDFNWIPDNDWGGTGMIALQEMLLQADGKKLFLLPAWPKDWDVHFKLHAPYNTTVECLVENGKIKQLTVLPKEREKDIIIKN